MTITYNKIGRSYKTAITAAFFAIISSFVLFASGGGEQNEVEQSYLIGNQNADIIFEVFADYQCHICQQFNSGTEHDLLVAVDNAGDLAIRLTPVQILGEESQLAASAALVSLEEGNFQRYQDILFEMQNGVQQGVFTEDSLVEAAVQANMDGELFRDKLSDLKYSLAVSSNTNRAREMGMTGTPTVVVYYTLNGQRFYETIPGIQPLDFYLDVVQQIRELKSQES